MRRIAVASALVVFLLGAYGVAKVLHRPRAAITAVATPPPVREATPIELRPGRSACQDRVAVDPETRVVRVYSGSPTPDVPRLRVTVRGDGWSTQALSPDGTGPGAGGDGIYDTRIDPPPRSLIATVCVASAEDRPAILAGSREDRVRSRSQTTVDGRTTKTRMALVLLAGAPQSPSSHPRELLERAAAFGPPVVGWVSLGLLALVVGIGVPAAALYATLRALRDDDRSA